MRLSKKLDQLLFVWWIGFFVSMVCSFRAISSIAIALIILTGLFKNKIDRGSWLGSRLKNRFLITCCLFYITGVTALLYTANFHNSLADLQTQTAIFFVPLAICSSNYISKDIRQKLMGYYIWTLAAVLLYCLLTALYKYCFMHALNDIFFYYELMNPFKQHAIFVSVYVFAGLVYLLDLAKKGLNFYNKRIHFLLIFYFTCCILLLSSKLVISFSICCFVYYFLLVVKTNLKNRFAIFILLLTGLAMIFLVMLTQNKISKRFNEILSGNLDLVRQPHFTPAIYFNGLQFRLLQWRFVTEILTEQHAWVTGVSGEAQTLLDKKYTSTNMYTGGINTATRGYLGYNTHDQFLQSLLQSGIPGLLVFMLICYEMIYLVISRQNSELTIIVFLLIAYCFNEAVFETQYGIILFTFFPLFLYYGTEKVSGQTACSIRTKRYRE